MSDSTSVRIRIHWKDGRSEVRTIKSSDLNGWERKVGKGYVSKVDVLKESKFEKYLLEVKKYDDEIEWGVKKDNELCHTCKADITKNTGGTYKGGHYCDDCIEEIDTMLYKKHNKS